MGNTVWQQRRKKAREAARDHAEGGPDRHAEFDALHEGGTYDKAYAERKREIEAQQEAFDHPLRQISRDASALWNRAESAEVSEVCRLIEALADYLVEKE